MDKTNGQKPETDSTQIISALSRQVDSLKKQVQSASLEMEVLRARMSDLKHDAEKVTHVEKFRIPDDEHMHEINEIAALMEKAILKERRNRRAQAGGKTDPDISSPQKIDERSILIVLKLRRKGCQIREIAAHIGLGVGTVHNIIKKYGSDPQMQELITEGTQMQLSDYFLIRPDDD